MEIWNAYTAGDLERAEAAQKRASEVTSMVRVYGLHATVKAVLSERLGIDCGSPRAPGRALTEEQRADVLRKAADLGLTRVAVAQSDD